MALTESHRASIPLKTEKIPVKVLSPRSTEATKSGLQDSVSEGLKSPKEMQKPPGTNPSTPARISSFSISSILSKPDKDYRKSTEEKEPGNQGREKEDNINQLGNNVREGLEREPAKVMGSPSHGHLGLPLHHPFMALASGFPG